jgi:PPIC-type PPIASE domain
MAFFKFHCPRLLMALLCLAALTVCSDKTNSDGEAQIPKANVLATVNGEDITDRDVQVAKTRSFVELDTAVIDVALEQKILDSLIASKAMKHEIKNELTAEDIARIQAAAKAYEEELYVKEYLQRNVSPEPVSAAMVQEYYERHLDEFGGQSVREFELLKAPKNLDEDKRNQLLKDIGKIRTATDWKTSASDWSAKYGVIYQQGKSIPGLLDKSLEEKVAALEKNSTSDVFYIESQLFLVRVTDTAPLKPQPLAEVSGDIRKKLAPLIIREAVKKASDQARSKAEVVMTDVISEKDTVE